MVALKVVDMMLHKLLLLLLFKLLPLEAHMVVMDTVDKMDLKLLLLLLSKHSFQEVHTTKLGNQRNWSLPKIFLEILSFQRNAYLLYTAKLFFNYKFSSYLLIIVDFIVYSI